jgi:hypothetical protein
MLYTNQLTTVWADRARSRAAVTGLCGWPLRRGFLYGPAGLPQRLTALAAIRARSSGSSRTIVPVGSVADTNDLLPLRSRSSAALIKAASMVKRFSR